MQEQDEFISPKDAAVMAHRDRQTIYRWFRDGWLTRYKTGVGPGGRGRTKVKVSELEKLIRPRACKDSATN